jgi:hypothetical protein
MADEECLRIKDKTAAQHGQLVGRIESRVMQPTPYSAGQADTARWPQVNMVGLQWPDEARSAVGRT